MAALLSSSSRQDSAKDFGAYYTDEQIAGFLAWWAIRTPTARIMDPCFGGGVFLRSACKRLQEIGGKPEAQVFGVELDDETHERTSSLLAEESLIPQSHLIQGDFFTFEEPQEKGFDTIIGNPPFIRYQRFNGTLRKTALRRSAVKGVHLPELCSAWAPFLVHCISMLRISGRLAMVLPLELAHAKYAQPVLEHLRRSFATATFLTFRRKLFPDLNEDTVLVLADDKGGAPARFLLRDFAHSGSLNVIRDAGDWQIRGACELDAETIGSAKSRLIEYLIPEDARTFYRELKRRGMAVPLGELADVGIGYVTGANDFFHLTPSEVRDRGIPADFLKPAVRRGRAFRGLSFTCDDWMEAVARGDAGYLLHIEKNCKLPPSVKDYLKSGESLGIADAYKCRTRSPWFSVPHVHRSDAFVTYMSGECPRLVSNRANAVAPNTLHLVRLRPLTSVPADALAALWYTSLTRLSVEIEGHALDGGMLKLEPTEARNVLIPFSEQYPVQQLLDLADELNELTRSGLESVARSRADEVILRGMMGLSVRECKRLAVAATRLSSRRGYGVYEHGVG